MRKSVFFDITSECNLRCIHCYNAEKYFKNERSILNVEDAKRIMDNLADEGFNHVHLLGGEPLGYSGIINFIEYCKEIGLEVSLNTNGTLLTENMQQELLGSGIDIIGCSLDGYDKETNDFIRGKGTFDIVTENISSFVNKKSKIKIYLVYTMTQSNIYNIEKLPDLIESTGVDLIDISLLFKAGNAIRSWNTVEISEFELLKSLERFVELSVGRNYSIQIDNRPIISYYLRIKYPVEIITNTNFTGCGAGYKNIYLEADGLVHPCNYFVADGGVDNLNKYGLEVEKLNLKLMKYNEVRNTEYMSRFRNVVLDNDVRNKREDCKECYARQICYPCPFENNFKSESESCRYALGQINSVISVYKTKKFIIPSKKIMSAILKTKFNIKMNLENKETFSFSDLTNVFERNNYDNVMIIKSLERLGLLLER